MKVLIIDDNKSIADMLSKILHLENIESQICNDGKNGLSLIEQGGFDAITLDIAMPDFSGIDVINSLEKSGLLKERKIIVLTASSLDDETSNLKKRGVYSVLQKPVNIDLFLSTLRS